jgi:hypothetical protein
VVGDNESAEYEYFEMSPPTDTASDDFLDNITSILDDENKPKYRPIFLSENAITLSDKVQIVLRFHGEPDEIHKNYDFVHATNYFYNDVLTLRPAALETLLSRRLVYQGSFYPLCSLFRIRKFMERGWRISAGEMVKIALQLSKLDFSNADVLREQMIGVDAAYFYELLRMIKEHQENGNGTLDGAYIIQLIDKLSDNPMYQE